MEVIVLESSVVQNFIKEMKLIKLQLEEIKNNKNVDPLLNTREAMEFLHISRSTLQSLKNENKITYSQCGSIIMYRQSSLDQFVDKYKVKGSSI